MGTFDPNTASQDDFDPSTARPVEDSGFLKNLGAGFLEGVTSIPSAITDPASKVVDAVLPFLPNNPAPDFSTARALGAGGKLENPIPAGSITHGVNKALGPFNPENVQATSGTSKAARFAGQGATAVLFPEGSAVTVGKLLAKTATGAIAGVGAGESAEIAPDSLKPLAALIGGVAAGVAGHAGGNLASRGASAGANAARSAAKPFIASVSEPTAQRMAGDVLKSNASNPQTVADMLMLPQPNAEIIPGSKPTTFQQTGDMGLGSLERGVAARNPAPFMERRAEQNSARQTLLGSLQESGNPADVATVFRSQLDDLDHQTAEHAHKLLNEAQAKAAAMGGAASPEHYGEALRTIVKQADEATREQEKTLWKAVDPKRELTGNVEGTRDAAKDILLNVGDFAKPMAGEEAAIFEAAKALKPIHPVSDLIDLRSRVSTEMRNELAANGRSPAYARLNRLRGAIQDNLSSTIAEEVASDAEKVAKGDLGTNQALGARLENWRNEWVRQREAQSGAASQAGGGDPSASGPTAFSGTQPAPGPQGAGFRDASGPDGLPPSPGSPTFDAAAADRLKAATAATREQRGTFGRGPIGQVLARAGMQDLFKLPEARVPEKFFHPGPTGFSDMQTLIKAVGPEKAAPLIVDYAASSLRRAAMREDGTLDLGKFSRWRSAHADSLRALPQSVRDGFSDAARASQTVEEVTEARSIALKDMQAGAIGHIMGATPEDISRHVGSIFGTKDAVGTMKQVVQAASKNPAAIAGLRRAVADHITSKFISNIEAGTSDQRLIAANAFQTFVRKNRPVLNQVMTPSQVDSLAAISDDLSRTRRSDAAVKLPGGSNTAQDYLAAQKQQAVRSKISKIVADTVAAFGGAHFGGPIGAVAAALGVHAIQAAREAGLATVDDLVTQAMLDPVLARVLLKNASPVVNRASDLSLARAIRRSVAGGAATQIASKASAAAPAFPVSQASPFDDEKRYSAIPAQDRAVLEKAARTGDWIGKFNVKGDKADARIREAIGKAFQTWRKAPGSVPISVRQIFGALLGRQGE